MAAPTPRVQAAVSHLQAHQGSLSDAKSVFVATPAKKAAFNMATNRYFVDLSGPGNVCVGSVLLARTRHSAKRAK